MEIKPTIIPASEITMQHLEDLAQQLFQQQMIKTEDLLTVVHNRRKVKVIDALITPKIAVLYVDKDTRNWPYTKGCKLCCDRQMFYIGDGIMSQIKRFPSP